MWYMFNPFSSDPKEAAKQQPPSAWGPPSSAKLAQATLPPPAAAPIQAPPARVSQKVAYQGQTAGPEAIDRSTYEDLVSRLNDKGVDSLKQQERGLGDMQAQLQMALQHNTPQLDLSPLMALTDSWSGSNLQQGYKRPDGFEKGQQNVQALQQALQKGRNDLSENEVNLLKSQLGVEAERLNSQERSLDRRLMAGNAAADRALRRQEMEDRKLEKDVQELGKTIGETAPMTQKFAAMNEILTQYSEGKEIPGVGRVESWKPDMWVSEDGQKIRQLAGGLKSDVIRMYSGTAAGEKEVARINKQLGDHWMQSPEQFRTGMAILKDAVKAKQAEGESRFRPEVQEIYQRRGGVNSKNMDAMTFGQGGSSPAPSGKPKTVIQNGHTYTLNEQTGEYE